MRAKSEWPTARLSDVCEINPSRPGNIAKLAPSHEVTFVPMTAVNQFSGQITAPEKRPLGEVRKGFTYFQEGDVIFAKITPCMQNGKAAVARNLANSLGFGSTEFHVVRPNPEKIIAEWVWHFLRQGPYRREAMHYFQGAVGQQRVPESYLEKTVIPLPSVAEQRRVVARVEECLDRVEEIELLRSEIELERNALFESLIEAEFQNVKGPLIALAEACEITSELIDPRSPKFAEQLHVGGANIESNTGRLLNLKTAQAEKLVSGKFPFDASMVLYNKIRPYLKKVARPEFEGVCSADMYPLSPNPKKLRRDYLFFLLLSRDFTRYAIEGSNRAGMPKVNRQHLFGYRFALPSLAEQERIAEQLDIGLTAIESMRTEFRSAIEDQDHLRDAILRKAFAGDL